MRKIFILIIVVFFIVGCTEKKEDQVIKRQEGIKAVIKGRYQYLDIELGENYGYRDIVVQKGIPVKYNIKAKEGDIHSCNYIVTFPEFGVEKELEIGDNIIEFTPKEVGEFKYHCYMGMILNKITVVENLIKYKE